MHGANLSMFRVEALRYRMEHQGQRRPEFHLPRLMARRAVLTLWIALALLTVGAAAACFAPVSISASGLALVAPGGDPAQAVALLLPAETEGHLAPGQAVDLTLGPSEAAVTGTVTAVEPGLLSSTEAQRRLGPLAAMVNGPVVLTWARLEAPDGPAMIPAGVSVVGRADLVVGTKRAGAFLPLVGRIWEK